MTSQHGFDQGGQGLPSGGPFEQPTPPPTAPPTAPPTWPAPHEQHRRQPYADPSTWSAPAVPGPRDDRGDRTLAAFTYLGMLVASIIVPLVFYVTKREESPYVRHHAAQAMNLSLTAFGYTLVGVLLAVPIPLADASGSQVLGYLAVACLVLVYAIVGLNAVTVLVYLIVAAVKASNGQYYRMPAWRAWRMIR